MTTGSAGAAATTGRPLTFLFMSSCPEPWGGSEELYAGAARILVSRGHSASLIKTLVVQTHPRIARLRGQGIAATDYYSLLPPLPVRAGVRLMPGRFRPNDWRHDMLVRLLRAQKPSLVVISQGDNFDGMRYTDPCIESGTPYVLLCQKASDPHWPPDQALKAMRRGYQQALRCYFVSHHNRDLTECQIGARLPNGEVVHNPFMVDAPEPLPWPDAPAGHFRIACVGRLFARDKGQDTLLRVLAQPKWLSRSVTVSFYGSGCHRQGFEGMAALLDLPMVRFASFSDNITDVWRKHHALVLCSRAEGLPLVLVEAMMCGRPGIVSNAGGNGEVIDDNVTGFLARGVCFNTMDEALDRAWERRSEWREIGLAAGARIREIWPADPCREFADKVLAVAETHGAA
ncbi:MAG: glycosyltransferase family 4 protein [Armatimonadetes bacterium]|nr:glycosyltransferase family 4 protein [Armatimonadota bacterium]